MARAFLNQLGSVARETIAGVVRLDTDNKSGGSDYDPVTAADRACERALREAIEASFPDDAIWGEEYGWSRQGAARQWSIDPIDGTRAFVCGLPSWAVLVGVIEDGHHVAGMIDLPVLDERVVAVDGATMRNGAPVSTSRCTRLCDARIATTDENIFSASEASQFSRLRSAARITRHGLDAMAYARVATGDIDLVAETALKPHDYDALVAVVRGAGGHVGNWTGGNDFSGGDVIAAASEALYREAVALLSG